MRAYLPQFELITPTALEDALKLLAREPGQWEPFAGGTDLMVLLEAGKLAHQRFLNIWRLKELHGMEETRENVTLGALTTYTEVQKHETLQREFPLLCRAAAVTGSVATQNRGTLGGNIANASPAADSPPALLVYDAELELLSARGARWVRYAQFHKGYKQMDLAPDELIARIRLPRRANVAPGFSPASWGWHEYYSKVGTRSAQAISKVCFAGAAQMANGRIADIRIALGSVAPTVVRCAKTEEFLRAEEKLTPAAVQKAQEILAGEIAPIDDFRSTARYRRRVAQNLLGEFLGSAVR
ncbi:MAG: xanthine dehydrogenase family protein subunit M [Acidobacteria bacterium]|nr:xanthine dehydrogenase family protein subunit M [Acidobacteriota bacterium]